MALCYKYTILCHLCSRFRHLPAAQSSVETCVSHSVVWFIPTNAYDALTGQL